MDQFVNRLDELDRLQALYESDAAELAIIYGRRQIGKSELVHQSISDHNNAVSYQASKTQRRCNSGGSSRQQRRPIQTSRPSNNVEKSTDRGASAISPP